MRFCSEALSDIGFGSVPLFESDLKNGERKYNLQIPFILAHSIHGGAVRLFRSAMCWMEEHNAVCGIE